MLEEELKIFLKNLSPAQLQDREFITIDISGEYERLYSLVSSIYIERSTGGWDFESRDLEFFFFKPSTRLAEVESFEVSAQSFILHFLTLIPFCCFRTVEMARKSQLQTIGFYHQQSFYHCGRIWSTRMA